MNRIEHHFCRETAVHALLEEAAKSALRSTGANHWKVLCFYLPGGLSFLVTFCISCLSFLHHSRWAGESRLLQGKDTCEKDPALLQPLHKNLALGLGMTHMHANTRNCTCNFGGARANLPQDQENTGSGCKIIAGLCMSLLPLVNKVFVLTEKVFDSWLTVGSFIVIVIPQAEPRLGQWEPVCRHPMALRIRSLCPSRIMFAPVALLRENVCWCLALNADFKVGVYHGDRVSEHRHLLNGDNHCLWSVRPVSACGGVGANFWPSTPTVQFLKSQIEVKRSRDIAGGCKWKKPRLLETKDESWRNSWL